MYNYITYHLIYLADSPHMYHTSALTFSADKLLHELKLCWLLSPLIEKYFNIIDPIKHEDFTSIQIVILRFIVV